MTDILHEALIKERVNDWLAAFSPGNKTFDFSVLGNLYWQDEQLLVFDTISPQTTRIEGWKSYETIWKPFMGALRQWQTELVGEIRILAGTEKIAVCALVFHSTATITVNEKLDVTAQATLVWEMREGEWRIIHEHISNPVR